LEDEIFNWDKSVEDVTLDLDEDCEEEYEDSTENKENCSDESSQDWESEELEEPGHSLDTMKNVLAYYDKCKGDKLWKTANRYSCVKTYCTIQRFRKYVEANGRKSDLFKKIEDFTYHKFKSARKSMLCVSDRDIKFWALSFARPTGFQFKASKGWLNTFKKRHRIVSRKITNYSSVKEIEERADIVKRGWDFVKFVKKECAKIPSSSMGNFDQSGLTNELKYDRTLSNVGEKETICAAKSLNATTHSHSIMPLIFMDGKMHKKLLVCLQESGGQFGKRVQKSLVIPENIYLVCSKSGKLDKGIMKRWLNDCVAPTASKQSSFVLIHDSWTGQTDSSLYKDIPNLVKRFQIPAKTTSFTQPLDVYFFRQYKILRRKLADRVMLEGIDLNLHARTNIIKMHSLIYNQLQSSIFQPMIKYSWYACKYVDDRAGRFLNVNEALFDISCLECDEDTCEDFAFIRCGHCRQHLCIKHFFISFHYHSVD